MSPDGATEASRAAGRGAEQAAVWQVGQAAAAPFEQAADLASQAAADAADDALAQARRLIELSAAEGRLDELARRWGATGTGPFAGRLLEWWHETTHNIDAAGSGSGTRLWMTEFGGPGVAPDPHAAADLRAVAGDGTSLADVQAKALAATAERIRQLGDEKYQGMGLLLPEDHADATSDLLARRIDQADPEFLHRVRYEDLQERITDRVEVAGTSSEPIDSNTLRDAAADPRRLAEELRDREQARSAAIDARADAAHADRVLADLAGVGAAALASGATGAAVSGMVSAVRHGAAARAGAMTPTAAALATVSDATAGFVRSAYVGGVGQGITTLAGRGLLPAGLDGGALPFAMAKASWELGHITARYAAGELTPAQAAAESATSMTSVSLMWAGSVIGQTVIPVPVVGALIGGMVGSLCSTVAVHGVTTIAGLARDAAQEKEVLAALEVEIAAALIVHAEERRILDELAAAHHIRFNEVVLPALDRFDQALLTGDIDAALAATNAITVAHDRQPLFTTVEQFDTWMHDPDTSLVLRVQPDRARSGHDPG